MTRGTNSPSETVNESGDLTLRAFYYQEMECSECKGKWIATGYALEVLMVVTVWCPWCGHKHEPIMEYIP